MSISMGGTHPAALGLLAAVVGDLASPAVGVLGVLAVQAVAALVAPLIANKQMLQR